MQITEYLDHQLDQAQRVLAMTRLADQVAAGPMLLALDDLATVLETRSLSGEDLLRLNVLLSQLYHAKDDVDRDLVGELRDVVSTVWEQTRARPTGH